MQTLDMALAGLQTTMSIRGDSNKNEERSRRRLETIAVGELGVNNGGLARNG